MKFENSALKQANNEDLPDFLREAYLYSLKESTRRDRVPIILSRSLAEREASAAKAGQSVTQHIAINHRPVVSYRNTTMNADLLKA